MAEGESHLYPDTYVTIREALFASLPDSVLPEPIRMQQNALSTSPAPRIWSTLF
jgi:hypothetical protein